MSPHRWPCLTDSLSHDIIADVAIYRNKIIYGYVKPFIFTQVQLTSGGKNIQPWKICRKPLEPNLSSVPRASLALEQVACPEDQMLIVFCVLPANKTISFIKKSTTFQFHEKYFSALVCASIEEWTKVMRAVTSF